jgi:5'-nucleotidase
MLFDMRILTLLLLCAIALAPIAHPAQPQDASAVRLRILAINDFHGQLDPPGPGGRNAGQDVGGAAYLASHISALRAGAAHSIVVSAGDLINASPFTSALFHDEPTIEAMNVLGLGVNGVGNHEFDRGVEELRRMQRGGCHPVDGCQFRERFAGARFAFLSANVQHARSGETLFPAYAVREFDGVPVAFIGVTLAATGNMVNPSGVRDWRFTDEADAANAAARELRQRGVEAIVLLIHEGGFTGGGIDECPSLSGPIVAIVRRLDPAIDAVISGHTHQAYNCLVDGRAVTSAGSYGRVVTQLDLTLDRGTRDVQAIHAINRPVTHDIAPDSNVAGIVEAARSLAARKDRVVGRALAPILRAGLLPGDLQTGGSGESALGDLLADAQLRATSAPDRGAAQIAFVNPGGVRADLAPREDGSLLYSQLFAVQPFGNDLVSMTLSGKQILTLLEQQFPADPNAPPLPRALQPSAGFRYTWRADAPPGQHIQSATLDGRELDAAADYRVTVNSFMAEGGDRLSVLTQGRDRIRTVVDVDALEAYFHELAQVAPPALGRIVRLP